MTTTTLTWKDVLADEKEKPYFKAILTFLQNEYKLGKVIYPAKKDIFNAFKYTAFEDVKVVILGQDPYHGPNQACGLCFAVNDGVRPPPSLLNIYKEMRTDVNLETPQHGDLSPWAKQGVLLLNTTLTVQAHNAGSHANIGWQEFTDAVIKKLNEHPEGIVFLLWGNYAQSKAPLIDINKHHVLTASHPSPLSAHRGFFGCRHFSKANEILKSMGREPVDWAL